MVERGSGMPFRLLGARDAPSISGLVTTQGPKCCRIATSPHVGSQRRDAMGSTIRCLVRRDTYRDSVELMRVAAEMEQFPGVTRAALLMATPAKFSNPRLNTTVSQK